MLFRSLPHAVAAQKFVLLALIGILGSSCTADRDPISPLDPATGRAYYPLAVGRFWEYDVEEHHWNYNRDSVIRFQVRERVDTTYNGATGELNYRLVRARRADANATWRDDSAVAIVLTPSLVHRTFANRPTIELVFPVVEGRSWNPNLFNAADSTSRTYSRVGQAQTLATGLVFPQTLRVADEANVTAVGRSESEAVYAWNVGRIYQRHTRLDYCNQTDVTAGLCQIGTGYIVRGTERIEQLRTWGPR